LHIPPGYDGTKPLALVFDVHGYSSFASEQLVRSKWDQMADKEGFVLIDPEGVNKSWNAGSCCGGNNQDDVKYFRDVVAKATAELCIDEKRVYVSGHSNGGAMAYRLACEAADIFAAAAPVCGWMTVSTCNPARAIPMLEIRGLNDGTAWCRTMPGPSSSNSRCRSHPTLETLKVLPGASPLPPSDRRRKGVSGCAGYPLRDFASLQRGREIPIASTHS